MMYYSRRRGGLALIALLAAGSAFGVTVNSEIDLRSALNPATGAQNGDTISFGSDITLTTADLPFVQHSVTIEGNSHTLNAGNHRGFFVGTPASSVGSASAPALAVALKDLTITGARVVGANGVDGFIPNGGWVIGGGGGGAGLGAALFVGNTASVTIANVTLNNNHVTGGAGGGVGTYTGNQSGAVSVYDAGVGGAWYGVGGGATGINTASNWSGGAGGFGAGGGAGGGSDCGAATRAQLAAVAAAHGTSAYSGVAGSTTTNGGPGGFGGGGGGPGNGTGVNFNNGGPGGFGGGSGGNAGVVPLADSLGLPMYSGGAGGGGAGLGGAIFVQQGGSLTVSGPMAINGNTAAGGRGASIGAGLGAGIFLQGSDANQGGGGSLTFAPPDGQTATVSDAIADQNGNGGNWRLAVAGLGSVVLSGSNSFGGGVTIAARGTLQIGAGGAAGSLQGNVANEGLLAFNLGTESTYSGIISGSGILNQAGTGTLILTGANTYTGVTRISAGTLQIGAGGPTGSIPATGLIDDNAALAFATTSATTYNGIIRGPGTLTQQGTGVLTLTAPNSYSGATLVRAGTLLVNNAGGTATGSGTVTVGASATFGGNGTIRGSLVAENGAVLAPGIPGPAAPAAGVLAVGGDVTVDGTVTATYWVKPDGTTAQLNVGGAFLKSTASPSRVLLNIGGFIRPGQPYTLATFRSTNFQSGDFSPTLPGVVMVLPNALMFRLP